MKIMTIGRVSSIAYVSVLVFANHAAGEGAIYPGRYWPVAASDLAAGDVDGDGDSDLVALTSSLLVTLRNDGGGNFAIARSSPIPIASSVALAQLDSDGKLDAVLGTLTGILASAGDGLGGFAPPIALVNGIQNGSPRVGDLNEDGWPDIVFGSQNVGAGFAILLGSSLGPVSAPVVVPGGGGAAQVELLDLDGDQHLDVLGVGPAINVWLGDGLGGFALAALPINVGPLLSFVVGDFDQDAIVDIITYSFFGGGTGSFFHGLGAGGFVGPQVSGIPLLGPRLFDFDQDGLPDSATNDVNALGQVKIVRCTGPAQFAAPSLLPVATTISRAYPLDADADGDEDLFIAGDGLTLIECRGPADYVTIDALPFNDPENVGSGDVNDDGYADLVAVRFASQLGIALGNANGTFQPFGVLAQVGTCAARDLALSDIDLDGDLDVTVAAGFEVHLFRGAGNGSFAIVQTSSLLFASGNPVRLGVDDATGDGQPDAVIAYVGQGAFGTTLTDVRYLAAQASGSYGGFVGLYFASNQSLQDMDLSDLNADSAADVVFTTGTQLFEIATNGAGGFIGARSIAISQAQPTRVHGGDLDGDGDADLTILDRAGAGGVRALLNHGSGFTIGPTTPTALALDNNAALVIADADGDANADAVVLGVANANSTVVEVVRGDGLGGWSDRREFSVATTVLSTTRLRAFDGDHDGRVDLAFASSARDHIEVVRGILPEYFDYQGAGCVGSGGFTPRLRLDGAATPGGFVVFSLENGLGGANALLFVGTQYATVALPGGCPLLTFPLLPIVFSLPLMGSGAGNGSFVLAGPLPGSLGTGSQFIFQSLVLDPGTQYGFSATNAARLTVR